MKQLTYDICMSAGLDAGNRNMRKNNRTKWNEDDYNLAAGITNGLLDKLDGETKQEVDNAIRNNQ